MAKQIAGTAPKPTLVGRVQEFYYEVKNEMGKVAWPTQVELKSSTSIVMLLLGILAAIVGIYDMIFQFAVMIILRMA